MHTLTIETKDQATTDKLIWFLNSLKSEGVRIVSEDKGLPVSKNTPNKETLTAFKEAEKGEKGETYSMSLDEFSKLCQ